MDIVIPINAPIPAPLASTKRFGDLKQGILHSQFSGFSWATALILRAILCDEDD